MISRSGTRTSGASSGVTKILRDAGSGPVVTAGSVVSGLERMFMGSSVGYCRLFSSLRAGAKQSRATKEIWIASSLALLAMTVGRFVSISSGLRILPEPLPDPRVGVGVLGDVADHGDRVGAGGEDPGGLLELDAADRDQRDVADALFPFGDFRDALRRKAHRFQRGRKNRTEGYVIRAGAERGLEFGIVMGGKAECQSGFTDGAKVGLGEILLAEMQMLGAGDDRRAPIIVD